jgi:hypothetical protein
VPCYSVFGLCVSADGCLPGFIPVPCGDHTDIRIKLGQLPPSISPGEITRGEPWYTHPYLDENGAPLLKMWEAPGGYLLVLCHGGITFAIDRAGSEIWGSWPERLTLELAALWLRGPVMTFLMALRGFVCLHASAVVIDGRAVVFAGPAGSGKSTTAAAFVRRGFAALSDDIAAISTNAGTVTVQPAFPQLCLWPESAVALRSSVEALPRLVPDAEKRYVELRTGNGGFHDEPAPLGAIYVLRPKVAGSGGPEIERLAGTEELLSLLANHHGSAGLARERRGMEFNFFGRIASQVPIRRVRVPRGVPCAEELCDAILSDFRASLEKK